MTKSIFKGIARSNRPGTVDSCLSWDKLTAHISSAAGAYPHIIDILAAEAVVLGPSMSFCRSFT
jgi:hypothetical protein